MASQLPPDTIQVKRKRGVDDGPVDFLRVDAHKRHRSTSGDAVWVYQRKQAPADPHRVPTMPVIRATEEGDENRPVKALRQRKSQLAVVDRRVDTSLRTLSPADLNSAPNSASATENMRRFHLSVSDSSRLAPSGTPGKRSAPAVFVERTPKKLKDSDYPIRLKVEVQNAQPTTAPKDPVVSVPKAQEPAQSTYKRPGQRARTNHTQELPKSLVQRDEGVDMDQLARDMDAYTLSQINQNMAKMEEDSAKIAARKAKYKPKPPAKRFAERHPEYAAVKAAQAAAAAEAQKSDSTAMDTSADLADDDDYVMETYERVPASRLRDQAVPASRVGLLVFDTEPDKADFFYGDEGDSDDEFPEDEENENCKSAPSLDPLVSRILTISLQLRTIIPPTILMRTWTGTT